MSAKKKAAQNKLIGRNIKKIREGNGMTRKDVCTQLGFPTQSLTLTEKGEGGSPSIYRLTLLAEYFNVSVMEFLK